MANTNPILDELSGLSPGAQQALMGAHAASTITPPQPPPVDPGLQAPSKIQKPAQIGAPPPAPTATMSGPPPSMGAPSMPNVPPPPGTLQGDINRRGEDKGAGITQIHSKIENSQFGQNHPTLGKIVGYGAELPLRVLEAAGNAFGPTRNIEQMLPGTQLHHAQEMRNLNATIGNESKENLQGAQTQEASARTAETGARTGLTEEQLKELPGRTASEEAYQGALTQKALHPTEDWEQATGVAGPNGEVMEHNKATGAYRIAPGAEGASLVSTDKTSGTPQARLQQELVDAQNKGDTATAAKLQKQLKDINPLGENRIVLQQQAMSEKIPMIVPDGKGGHILAYMQPGQTVPEGAVTPTQSGAGSELQNKNSAGANKALTYANEYMKSGQFTGAGDEALQDQYFEMAKPSSGFRMNQSQIDQLHKMTSWMGSIEGAAYHAKNGTWFNPQQREQIVATMNALGKAAGVKQTGGGGAPTGGTWDPVAGRYK